jgi:hypothetical protein
MNPLEKTETICRAAKGLGKPCLYLSFDSASKDWEQNAKILKRDVRFLKKMTEEQAFTLTQSLIEDGFALISCSTNKERDALFRQVDGDDTGGNVYAMTISAAGVPLTTNT